MGVREIQSTDRVPIQYAVTGSGGKSIVLVHCWSGDRQYWRQQTDFLKKYFQVVTVDLAGHGSSGSGRDRWTIPKFGDDLLAVLDDLNLSGVILVGHSMGGMVALNAASRSDRVDKLILVDILTNKFWPVPAEELREQLKPYRDDFAGYTYRWVRDELFPSGSDPDLQNRIARDMSQSSPEIAVPALQDLLSRNYDRLLEKVTDKQIPICVINAGRWETDIEFLEQWGIRRIEIIEGVGHFPRLEKPDHFNEILLNMISR